MYKTKPYYEANKQYYKDKAKSRRLALRKMIEDIKSVPCVDCNVQFPSYAMDFDHRENKINDVARLVSNGTSLVKILQEINKCDIVCANCHRIRTYGK